MKRIFSLIFAISYVLALAGCSKTNEPTVSTGNIEDTVSAETQI